MKKIARLSLTALMLVAFPAVVCAQIAEVGEANVQPTPQIKNCSKRSRAIGIPARKESERNFSRTEASAKEDRAYGWGPAAPRW